MNAQFGLTRILEWLLGHSLQAGVLVLLVVLVQWTFRRRLTNRWRFALWWVVLARLLLPCGPQSAISVFNYVHPPASAHVSSRNSPAVVPSREAQAARPQANLPPASANPDARNERSDLETASLARPVEAQSTRETASQEATSSIPTQTPNHWENLREHAVSAAAAIWLAGVAALTIFMLVQIFRFRRRLFRSVTKADATLCGLLSDCRREFDVKRPIELLETEAVKSPALFGLIRLRLLLPKGFSGRFSESELRYIFLHEVAHVKRGDLWLNWLITALQIAHWFNPLIWFGFARLRSDRELACDELALLHAGEKTGTPYGETIIKLLEGLSRPAAIPGLVGILEDRKQMRRRIRMIANFKRPGRWSALALLLVGVIAAATLTDAQSSKPITTPKPATGIVVSATNVTMTLPDEEDTSGAPRPDLTGEVRAKGGGALAATVFISTAGPKTGTSVFCPSCYADCRKSAKANSDGQFKIESLSPQLIFRILAVAKGYKPQFVSKVDPTKGPVSVELEPITSTDAPPERSLHGRVVDPKGAPVAGATVEMQGVEGKDGSGAWGAIPGVDPLAVTDENGEFLITAQKPFDMMAVKVEARLFAPRSFDRLPSGSAQNELNLTEGSTLTGRVMLRGKPLKGVAVGISGVDREAGSYLGHFEVGTGENGVFLLVNVPPDADFYIYGIMSTMKQYGAIPMQKIHTGKDGQTVEFADLAVGPAHRLRGRIELSDGQPVPAKTRLLVSREEAWDSMQVTLDKEGGFDTEGLPEETISLSTRVKGYHISPQNKSLDRMNFQLIGRVDRDISGLVCLLDKGPDPQPDFSSGIPESDRPENRPLAGAEGGVDHSHEWKVSGRVFDSETKEAVASFRVTPGQTDSFGQTGWDTLHEVQGDKSGAFVVYVNKRVAEPLLKVEADGYLPGSLPLELSDAANIEIPLTKGTGPAGTVVFPDGTPAAKATVALVCEGMNQVALDTSKGELTTYWRKNLETTADASGHFSFNPQLGVKAVAAATTNGFAVVPLETLKTNAQIILEAYGKITGILKRPSEAGTNEELDLSFTDKDGRGLPSINLNCHTVTDSEGRFTFDGVPPAHLRLSYRVAMQRRSWRNEPLQEIDLQPGQALELKVEAAERSKPDEFANRLPPKPRRIPGTEIKGVVLAPSGKPAVGVDVALQVNGIYLGIHAGAFSGSQAREEGLQVNSKDDGKFSLPMFEGAQSVVAISDEGFAQVSLEDFKKSPKITLQKWGRLEGTLEINHHPGTNETIAIDPIGRPAERKVIGPPPLIYQGYTAKVDADGHFAMEFIPPGEATISRQVPLGNNSFTHRRLATMNIKAGETTTVDFHSEDRIVTGKLAFNEARSTPLSESRAYLATPSRKFLLRLQAAETAEEREALMDSPEFEAAMKDHQEYYAALHSDGTFVAEDVPPGKYDFYVAPMPRGGTHPDQMPTNFVIFASAQEIVVPQNADKNSNTPFDTGTVQVKPMKFSTQGDED